ncbi:MAG: HigA family addiction module antitoxin, partial [Cyclobacteriaceae bacterium]|nr:HigA family addiction module antitoxin [Cyclobacteriaceae bacterium]
RVLKNIHPGEILLQEFMIPLGISIMKLSRDTKIPYYKLRGIVRGQHGITPTIALKLSRYFGNSAKFWLGLQNDYDLEEEERLNKKALSEIVHCQALTV